MTTAMDVLAAHAERITLRDRVLRCVIATGAAGNTLDFAGIAGLTEVLATLADSAEVGAVLLASEGESFCTGGNVKNFHAAPDRQAYVTASAERFHAFVRALVETPFPVVAGVPGWAVGAGMSVVCASDITVGGPGTRFRAAYPSIGFSPDGGMSWSLPRIIGPTRARDLLLTDRIVEGEEAARLGLLTRLVADDEINATAARIATELAAGPTTTLARIKRLAWASAGNDLPGQLAAEAISIGECAASPAGVEGVDAFVQRRRPDYRR